MGIFPLAKSTHDLDEKEFEQQIRFDERERARRLRFDKPRIYRRGGKWVCSSFARGLAGPMYQETPVAAYNAWLEYWDDFYRRLNAPTTNKSSAG